MAFTNERRSAAREGQLAFDEQLSRLEEDLRRLKVEFDVYFGGGAKRPPYDTKNRVETLIKRLADERGFSYVQRFRYNSLVARYTSFREMWRRAVQEREEGRDAASRAAIARQQQSAKEEKPQTATSFVCADAQTDVPTVKSIYEALIAAKKECGETCDDLTFARFHRLISSQSAALKERLRCDKLKFSVSVNDGRVSFRAEAG